jgi:serine/threonine protein kinase
MDEIKIWAKLNNNFIVRYKSSWIENGEWNHIKDNTIMLNQRVLYIQMEMCRMTLRKAVIQINKELNQNYENGITLMGAFLSSQLFIEILEGLNYLHSQKPPVIHRDLKLTNILITDGQNGSFVKICDFGLATINKSETGNSGDVESFDINQLHTKTLGTPKYMAEEVKRGKYDTPADMYSLGVILCELFCLKIENLGNFEENLRKSFEYYPIKQIRLIRQLLQQWPSMRPNCEQVLRQKHKWSVSFDEIKFSEKFAQILYQKFNSQFRETNDKCENEEKISTEILIKKCHYAIEESFKTIYTNEKATSGVINEFRFMKNAISVNIIYIFSNIVESDVKNDMIKLILHSLYIFDNLPEMCYNIEKSLNDNYDSIWHCFASPHQQHSFSQRIINWFNCPYFIISFCNHFLENEMHILIVNTPINKSHETSQVVAYNNSLWHKNNNPQLFMELSQKAINDFDSVSKMQLFIENILKQIYPNQQIYCYIGKNELFSCHEYPTIPDIYFACRIKEFCILISSECVEKADKTLIQNEEKILKKIRRDDKNAIIDAFTPQFVYGGFVLKQFKLNDQKKCIIRINDECRYSQKNYANYKLSIYDIQILWLNNNQSEKSIEIKCGENDSKRLRRYKMTHEEIECQLETIKNIFSDINSSTELLFDSIKSCRKILSYGEFNKDNDKIRSLGLLNIAERLLNNNENNEIVIVLLQTLNYYMKTMMITDDDSIINILIPHYTKLLKSTDDNICFYTVEGFQVMSALRCLSSKNSRK